MGLYDEIDNEVLGGKTNTNNNASSVGLFDEIDNEVQNAQSQPSFMDDVKGLGQKVLRKGKSIINNLNVSNPYENTIKQPVIQNDTIQNDTNINYNPVKNYNDLYNYQNIINSEALRNTQSSNVEPMTQQTYQTNTVNDRLNAPMISFKKNRKQAPLEELLYKNTISTRGGIIAPSQTNEQEQVENTNFVDGYSLEKANERARKTFPELNEFVRNNDIALQGRVFENENYVNPNQVEPTRQFGNVETDNGSFNFIEDENAPLNNPENFSLSAKEKAELNKKLGLDGFYKNIHSKASKVLDGHDNIKSGIKHFVKAGIGLSTSYCDMLYMLGDKFDNNNLRDIAKKGYLTSQHLQNLIQTDENSEGLKNFFEHPVRNITNLLADSSPLMGTAIGGSIIAGGLAAGASAPVWVVTLASGAAAWAINSVFQGEYIQKKQELERQLGRKLNSAEIENLQHVTGVEKAIVGGLETCADMLGVGKFIGKVDPGVKAAIKNIVKKGLEQALEEGLTESAQEVTSIAAEKQLGINKGDNVRRVLEAGASGLILGGVMGGAGGATNRQAKLNNQTQGLGLSQKAADVNNLSYDVPVDTINTTGNYKTEGVGLSTRIKPERQYLTREEILSQVYNNITGNKGKIDGNAYIDENGNYSYLPKDEAPNSKSYIRNLPEEAYNKQEKDRKEYKRSTLIPYKNVGVGAKVDKNEDVIQKQAPNTYEKQQAKAEAKEQAKQDLIENLAPNTTAEQKAKEEIKSNLGHTKDFNKGDIVRDAYSGEIFEVVEPDKRGMGHLRNVDTNEIHTINAHNNQRYEKYEHNPDELIEVEEFKYDEKNKIRNAENYMYSKQEVIDAYNEYVKNPTEANKEKYEDVSGKALKEFSDNEEAIKNGTFKQQQRVENTEKGNTNEVVDTSGNTKSDQSNTNEVVGSESNKEETNNEIENIAKEYSQMLGQDEVRDFHRDFAAALVNKNADTIKRLVAQGRGMNENSKKMFTKHTGIKLPSTIQGKKDVIDKWAKGEITSETKAEEITNSLLPSIKYKVKIDKKGTADGFYMENSIFHTDGNAAYLKEFVNADTTKVERSTEANETTNKLLQEYFDSASQYTDKLEDFGKGVKKDKNTYRVFKAGENESGKPKYIAVNDKYLLDKKDLDLYYNPENSNTALSIRKNGKQIGIVMPMVRIDTDNLIDLKPIKHTTKEIAQIEAKGNISKKSSSNNKITEKLKTKKQEIKEKCENATNLVNNELKKFIPDEQRSVILENLNKSEEKEHFADLMFKLKEKIDNAPGLYGTDGDKTAKPILKYFAGNIDAYIFEIDKETGEMFGIGSMGHEYEAGYYTPDMFNSVKSSIKANKDGTLSIKPSFELDLYDDLNVTKEELLNGTRYKTNKNGNIETKGVSKNGSDERVVLQQSGMEESKSEVNEESDRTGRNQSETSTSVSDLRRTNDTGLDNGKRLKDEHKALIEANYKNQHELNKSIENFINNKEYEVYNGELPEEIKSFLKRYAGAGGLEKQGAEGKGLLSEYYTPDNIVKKMWDLTSQYINTDGSKVLEPSVGIGRFLEYAPSGTNFDVVEMNPVSAKITELLYPDANVTVGQFQERFMDFNKNLPVKNVTPEYDIVIGNPPYGEYSGKYKGLGEGKKYRTLQAYFINRGLDTLKENGVMTFIVPSSFLDNIGDKVEISGKAELLDAYRLPEKTFDTTSIGTDIIVLRKRSGKGQDTNFLAKEWFKKHPEKILGVQETRKNRFGKEETFVKGDKNAVEKIRTSKKDIKETKATSEKQVEQVKNTKTTTRKTTKKTEQPKVQGKVEYNEYKPEATISEEDLPYYTDTRVDGTLPKEKYSPGEKVNQFNGKLYNDFNYLQGDIYEKLDALENENISDKQKEIQRKKLEKVLPKPKKISEIKITPSSDFVRNFSVSRKVINASTSEEVDETIYLDKKYIDYVYDLTNTERNGVKVWDIIDYVNGKKIRTDYKGYSLSKEEKANQKTEYLTKLKNTVDKTFNDFINSELSYEEMRRLEDTWNRQFNRLYTPDYKKIPMIVKGLSDTFYGSKLKLQDVQVEGINYLTNKGVGLLGFEVGVGKTLSGIISTVQNMQMGRCKRPFIIVPKSVKPNWIREINQAFPNIKVNDVDNLSKFNGEIEDGSITIGTYQALENLWYNDDTIEKLTHNTSKVRTNYERELTKRGLEKSEERNAEFIGKALQGNKMLHKVEDLGFDHITIDEAHNFKNLFGDARADGQEGNVYSKISGSESTRAKRLFLLSQYVLENNDNRNVFMLTATPFNNSPLEVFNMLSYIAKDKLDEMGIYNVYQFMENYVDLSADWVVDSKNNVSYKQIAKGFKNLQSLQSIIDSCMLIRSAEDAGIERPNKTTRQYVLNPTEEQKQIIAEMEALAVGIEMDEEGNIRHLDKEEAKGAQLKALTKSRIATLSPDIYNNNLEVTPEDFIKNSPKLDFIMKAIEVNKKKDKNTSQLIYMPIGTSFLPKIKQYLVNKGIYKANEVEIIQGGIKDDKISSITDSFNDRNGNVKVIIGTDKIKEGMNLNKNSSVLYVPFIDWNPTDYVQVVGRIWRRGNRYKNIRVVIPTLNDSTDSFMYQKLDEKTSRINNIMDRGKDYIDTGELNAAEEKLNMITNPDKKALMFSQIENQKLETEKSNLEGQLADTRHYQRELARAESNVKNQQEGLDRNTEKLKDIEDKESWQYRQTKGYIDAYKKDLKKAEKQLEYVKNKIDRLELDFEGKDSEENIQKEIEKVQKEIENLKETTELKKAQYRDEYEKNKKEGKKIEDYVAEFEKETDELLKLEKGVEQYSDELSTDINKDSGKDLSNVHEAIKNSVTVKELLNILELPEEDFINALDYTTKTIDKSAFGSHNGENKIISFNIERIGNDEEKLIETLVHEVGHANQYKEFIDVLDKINDSLYKEHIKNLCNYNYCKNKDLLKQKGNRELNNYMGWSGLSKTDKNIIRRMRELNLANGKFQEFKELHKDKIDDIVNQVEVFDITKNKKILIPKTNEKNVKKYCELGEKYFNVKNERSVRKTGRDYKGKINEKKQEWRLRNGLGNVQGNVRGRNIRGYSNLSQTGNNSKSKSKAEKDRGIGNEQYSIEDEIPTRQDEINIEKSGRDKIYEWHADIGKNRFDVNKTLQSTINMSKSIAKEYSKTTGQKISDKMVREILPFLRERTEVPEALGRKDLSKFYNSLTEQDITRLTKFADDVCGKFDKYWKNYKEVKGILTDEDIENHISHIWKTNKTQKGMLTNFFQTNSKFAKPRTIETLVKGIEQGYEPKTLDIAEILRIQSDSLIKAAADTNLANTIKNMRYGKKLLVQQGVKAPADWVEINHPALNKAVYQGELDNGGALMLKQSVKVHPALADVIAPVFETQKPDNKFWKAYDIVNGTLKQVQMGFSGFHGYALSESAIGNIGIRKTLKSINPKEFWNAVKNGDYDIYKQDKDAKQAIEDGLQLGTPLDMDRNLVEEYLKKIPVLGKYAGGAVEANNKILWDCLHNAYKLESYKIAIQEAEEKNGKPLSKEQRRAIAQWVNDSFGGQCWELLGIRQSTIKGLKRAMLSPDWFLSTTRQFMGMFNNAKIDSLIEGSNIKGLKKAAKIFGFTEMSDAAGIRGAKARKFWVKAMMYSLVFYNVLNAMFRLKDKKEHPELYTDSNIIDYTIWGNSLPGDSLPNKVMPYIFIGRNKDGSARYLRLGKQFREVPELLADPVSKLAMKSASLPSVASQAILGYGVGDIPKKLLGKDDEVFYNQELYKGFGKNAKRKKGAELYKGMAKTAAKTSMPFIAQNALNEYHNKSAWDLFAQTSNGMSYTKTSKQFKAAYEHGNKQSDIEKIRKKAIKDGLSYKTIRSAQKKAKDDYKQELIDKYSIQYVKALKEQNQSEINKVANKLVKENVPADIRRKVYKTALKEYRKSVK